jgi:murein DD-endopeptidase
MSIDDRESDSERTDAPAGLSRRTFIGGATLLGSFAALGLGDAFAFTGAAAAASEYIYPTSWRNVTDSFFDHKNRPSPSVNPGTDYDCPPGTPVVAVKAGRIVTADTNPDGSGGRVIYIDHPDGSKTDYLHMSTVAVSVGQVVAQGQQIGLSGGSAGGSESGVGAHLHISLHIGPSAQHGVNAGNVDFELYVGSGGPGTPTTQEDDTMLIRNTARGDFFVTPGVVKRSPNPAVFNILQAGGMTIVNVVDANIDAVLMGLAGPTYTYDADLFVNPSLKG